MPDFFNLYRHGLIRVAAAVPEVRVADPAFNVESTLELARRASAENAVLTVFPELGITACSCEDLFHQQSLLEKTEAEIGRFLQETAGLNGIFIIGAPLEAGSVLCNCALVISRARILGIVPKTYLPNYREHYQARHFSPGSQAGVKTVNYCNQQDIPFGTDLLFKVGNISHFTFAVEICEDLQVPVPPSSLYALAGAVVIANPAAGSATAGKAGERRLFIAGQSARCLAAYVYAGAGAGESTTDLVRDGHALIVENGKVLAESEPFGISGHLTVSETDLEYLARERLRSNIFAANYAHSGLAHGSFRTVNCEVTLPEGRLLPVRSFARFPYLPDGEEEKDRFCAEVFSIQVHGLAKRLMASGIKKVVIGVSGGLDSAHALLVAVKAAEILKLPRTNIMAYSLPGFATSGRTRKNAWRLIRALGVYGEEVDIRPGSTQMLQDIGHPAAQGEESYDKTYENVQAGQRYSILFRLANRHRGLVLGAGDLSEIALGWTTYGVGDHMSHYNVNAGIPKTLLRLLLLWQAKKELQGKEAGEVIMDILNTAISPELVPGEEKEGQPAQQTEEIIGPYELQDFNIYYTVCCGFRPAKVAFLAYNAWRDKYSLGQIKHWLQVFLTRFFAISQFKRSAMPDGPKALPGVGLSPRGDWRAPSDSAAAVWLEELQGIPEIDPKA